MRLRSVGRRPVTLLVVLLAVGCAPRKKIIEFGWDEPDTAFLRRHVQTMEQAPFDGCVFHAFYTRPDGTRGNFTWDAWGRRAFREEDLRQAFDDLDDIRFRRFRHNFLRLNVTPGNLDWFDDHSAVMKNARLAARLARRGQARGILLDVEQYQGRLFDYATLRHASGRSWADYAAKAQERGREVMQALQDGYPGLVVFLTFGPSLPYELSGGGRRPLAENAYGLLAPFLDGMFAAARGSTRVVDGYELSYGFTQRSQFQAARQRMTVDILSFVADPDRYRKHVSVGFGLWLDYDWRKQGFRQDDPDRNYFTPASFRASLDTALELADEFVWVYTETPRWWTEARASEALPEAYVTAIREARAALGLY